MSARRRTRLALSGAACAMLALCVTHDAAAQFGGNRRATTGVDRGNRDTAQQRDARPAQDGDGISYEVVEYRLTLFAEALRPTAEQMPLWQDFQKKVRLYAADVARQRAARMAPVSMAAAQPGAQKHLAQAVDDARNRLAALEDVEVAANALWQLLTADQRSVADTRIPTIVAPRPLSVGAGSDTTLPRPPVR